jgi:hypothetical protein
MKLAEICQQLDLEVKTETGQLDIEVTAGYATDLLSCAMAKAQAGNVWVTLQSHPNVVAVASLLNLAGVIITEGMVPEEATIEKAQEEGVNILTTPLTTYTVIGRLFALGVLGVD